MNISSCCLTNLVCISSVLLPTCYAIGTVPQDVLWNALGIHTIKRFYCCSWCDIRLLTTLANREANAEYFILPLSLWSGPCSLCSLFEAVLVSVVCLGGNIGSVSNNSIVNFWFSCLLWTSGTNANTSTGMEDFHCHTNLDLVLSCLSSSKTASAAALHAQRERGGNKGKNKAIKIERVSNCESLLMTWDAAQL